MSKKVLSKNLNKELRKMKRQIKARTPEIRVACSPLAPTGVPTSGLIYEVTNLSTADRAGEKIRLKNIRIKYHTYCLNNATVSSYTLRVMLVRSKIGPLSAGTNYPTVTGCPDYDKYHVLADKIYEFNANAYDGSQWGGFKGVTINVNKKYKIGTQVQYDGTASSANGGVYLYLISDNPGVVVEGYRLMKYTDV